MGREPLGLPLPVKFTPGCPGLPRAPTRLGILATLPNQSSRQPCSVSGAWEAVAGAVEICWNILRGSTWPEPASLPYP
eukprot:1139584-Pelagomonas_calceolata.AAC.5